jgi:uncharacterized BrkB/YihY/UPF0761 family membrane protein
MTLFSGKKGSAIGYVLILLFVLFVYAIIFVSLYPVYQGIDNFVTPMVSGSWLTGLANWRSAIFWSPTVGFLIAVVWLIYKIANDNGDQQIVQ